MKQQSFLSSYTTLFSKEIVIAIVAFILSIILGRFLGPKALGLYIMLMAYIELFTTFTNLGIETTLTREFSKGMISKETITKIFCNIRLPLIIVTGLMFFIIMTKFLGISIILTLLSLIILASFSLLRFIESLFYAKRYMRQIAFPEIISSLVWLFGSALFIFVLKTEIEGVFISKAIGLLIATGIIYFVMKKSDIFLDGSSFSSQKSIGEILHHAKWFAVSPILGTIQGKIGTYVLSIISTSANIGFLGIGQFFRNLIFSFIVRIAPRILLPTFSEIYSNKEEMRQKFFFLNTCFVFLSFIITFFMLPLIGPLIIFIYGVEYKISILLGYIFLLDAMLYIIAFCESSINATLREDIVAKISTVSFILSVPLTLFFFTLLGLKGIALAMFIVTSIQAILGTLSCAKLLDINIWKTYIPQAIAINYIIVILLLFRLNFLNIIFCECLILLSLIGLAIKEKGFLRKAIFHVIEYTKKSLPQFVRVGCKNE